MPENHSGVAYRSPLGNLGRKAPDSNRSRWLGDHWASR